MIPEIISPYYGSLFEDPERLHLGPECRSALKQTFNACVGQAIGVECANAFHLSVSHVLIGIAGLLLGFAVGIILVVWLFYHF